MTLEYSRVTLAAPLWTVAEVKAHLRITDTDHDADVTQKRDAAQEIILAYLTTAADATWTPTTAPQSVKHAVLLLTTHLYEDRGDEIGRTGSESSPGAAIWKELQNLLSMFRDPTLA